MPQADVKYSVFQATFRPIWMISENLGAFSFWGGVFALVITGLSLLFSAAFGCSVILKSGVPLCLEHTTSYMFYFLTKILLLTVFIKLWAENVSAKPKNEMRFDHVLWGILKTFICFVIFIVANLLPMFSAYILYFRASNPNWLIELAVFTVVGVGFLMPFILMRFYALLGERLDDDPPHSIWSTWQRTSGFGIKLLFSVALIYVFVVICYLSAHSGAINLPIYAGMFVQNFVLLLNVALVVNFLLTQKYIFWAQK